jgi:hypothetical protein
VVVVAAGSCVIREPCTPGTPSSVVSGAIVCSGAPGVVT